MKKILTVLALALAAVTFSDKACAQMTDDAIMKLISEGLESGKSQTELAKELAGKGMTAEQMAKLKEMYSGGESLSAISSLNAASQGMNTMMVQPQDPYLRTRIAPDMDFVLFEQEFTVAMDSLAAIKARKEVFGRSIFAQKGVGFASNINVPTPENYKLGPGDEVIIDIWGSNEATIRQTISPDGFINIPNIGVVSLNGMTVKESDSYLRKKMGRIYPVDGEDAESDIKLTLGNIRTIQVSVVGEVAKPGSYFVSSLSSVYNALYLAGGVSEVGSLREISLVRNNKTIAIFDIYDFILNGKFNASITLQDGDVITVPPYKNLVDMAGKVKRPMVYEMKDGESVKTILDYAGGFTGDAYKSNLRLIRRNGVEYQVYTVDNEDFDNFILTDADSLTVDEIIDRYENKVDIQGAVYRPGAYQLSEKIATVAQLLKKAEGVKGDAFINRALLYRERPDLTRELIQIDLKSLLEGRCEDIALQRNDSLHVASIHEITDVGDITIEGEVAAPGTFKFVHNMTIEDLILQAGGLLESASTVKIDVSRRIKEQASKEHPDSVGQIYSLVMKDGYIVDNEEPFFLQPYDQVLVRRSPGYFSQTSVTISGEVLFPGSYVLTYKTERLSDLVKKAGGLNSWAYVKGARLQRVMNDDEQRRFDSTMELVESARDSIVVDILEEENNTYYVGIDLSQALAHPGSDADLVLREGDQLFVPEYVNTVKISGNVMYPNTVTFDPAFRLKDYVEMAGGYGYQSKRNKAYVIYMNGTVKRVRQLSNNVIEPGCEIVIPQRRQGDLSMTEILSMATTSSSLATMLATMGNLVSNIKR